VLVWRAVALSAAVLIAAGCTAAPSPAKPSGSTPMARGPGYSVPLSRIIADANADARHYASPTFHLAPAATKAAMPAATAKHDVVSGCNEGRSTRVLGAAVVTGPMTVGSRLYWAVFVDPPGKHVAPYLEGAPKNPTILNWIGGFVPVNDGQHPICDYGHAANLPPLPIFKS
jgi:hypothetical protein